MCRWEEMDLFEAMVRLSLGRGRGLNRAWWEDDWCVSVPRRPLKANTKDWIEGMERWIEKKQCAVMIGVHNAPHKPLYRVCKRNPAAHRRRGRTSGRRSSQLAATSHSFVRRCSLLIHAGRPFGPCRSFDRRRFIRRTFMAWVRWLRFFSRHARISCRLHFLRYRCVVVAVVVSRSGGVNHFRHTVSESCPNIDIPRATVSFRRCPDLSLCRSARWKFWREMLPQLLVHLALTWKIGERSIQVLFKSNRPTEVRFSLK